MNREHTEVLQELNINGIMDTSYTYGNERLTNERFTGEAAYYTYDPRGSVSGLTDSEGMLHQSYRYDPFGGIDFGKPQYNNVYAYNAESYNGNTEHQYLRARYYDTDTADFITEDSYLGKITDPLTLNRYNYVKSSPLNYMDPSGCSPVWFLRTISEWYKAGEISAEAMAAILIFMNINNLYNGFHEIAQVLSAEALSRTNVFTILEQKVEIAGTKGWFGKCKTKEIDILADTTVWEVKPVTYLFPGKSTELAEAIAQIQLYADNALGYHKGAPYEFPGVYNVKLFRDIYMSVDTAKFYMDFKINGAKSILPNFNGDLSDLDGLLFYSLSRGGVEGSLVPVSIPVTVQDMEKNRNEALFIFATIAGATLLQDVVTWGAGVLDDIVTLTAAATAAVAILVR